MHESNVNPTRLQQPLSVSVSLIECADSIQIKTTKTLTDSCVGWNKRQNNNHLLVSKQASMSMSSGSSSSSGTTSIQTPVEVDPEDHHFDDDGENHDDDDEEEEEETTTYESLYDMRRAAAAVRQHQQRSDCESCCSNNNDIGHERYPIQRADSLDDEFDTLLQLEKITLQQQQQRQQQQVEVEPADGSTNGPNNGDKNNDNESPSQNLPLSQEPESLPDLPLEIGDHVYQWRSFAGIPGVFQHHGIVMDIRRDDHGEMELSIADFSCLLRAPSSNTTKQAVKDQVKNGNTHHLVGPAHSIDMITGTTQKDQQQRSFSLHPHGILRVYNSSSKDPKWHKVVYKANLWKTTLWRSGTCTATASDPPAMVLARAYFLL